MSSLFEDGTLVNLTISTWSGKRKLTTADIAEHMQTDTDPDFLRLRKCLVDDVYLQPIMAVMNRARKYLYEHSLDFPIRGVNFLPRNLVSQAQAKLEYFRGLFMKAVQDFATIYGEAIETAKDRLNGLFRARDYPTADEITGFFSFGWQFMVFAAPGRDTILDPAIYRAEQLKFERTCEQFRVNAVETLRSRFAQAVGKVAAMLDPQSKRITESNLTNLREFLRSVDELNISDDAGLKALTDQTREMLGDSDVQALRDDQGLKARVHESMSNVERAVDALVESRPARLVLQSKRNKEAVA